MYVPAAKPQYLHSPENTIPIAFLWLIHKDIGISHKKHRVPPWHPCAISDIGGKFIMGNFFTGTNFQVGSAQQYVGLQIEGPEIYLIRMSFLKPVNSVETNGPKKCKFE